MSRAGHPAGPFSAESGAIVFGGAYLGRVRAARLVDANSKTRSRTVGARSIRLDRAHVERQVASRLADWQAFLRLNVVQTRQLLRKILEGPIVFQPVMSEELRGYRFNGRASFGKLLAGIDPKNLASPTGSMTRWDCDFTSDLVPAA
jgi:hypothetical protein